MHLALIGCYDWQGVPSYPRLDHATAKDRALLLSMKCPVGRGEVRFLY
jgi:hypothetical protein